MADRKLVGMYQFREHDCDIRNWCTDSEHWHTIRPDGHGQPGNFLGVIVECDGNLDEAVATARVALLPPWTQAEIDDIQARAAKRAENLRDMID